MAKSASRFVIEQFGQVLWIIVQGGIDRDFAQRYRDAVRAAATPLIGQPWIRINDIRGWQLGGPEVIPPLHELMLWCEQNQLAHSINIVSLPHLQTYMLNQMMAAIPRRSVRHMLESPAATFALLEKLQQPLTSEQQDRVEQLWQQLQ